MPEKIEAYRNRGPSQKALRILELYTSGKTYKQIMDELGCTEGVGAFDTLSLWLNGDDEEPAWRAMHFTLGDFGKLQAAIAEVQE